MRTQCKKICYLPLQFPQESLQLSLTNPEVAESQPEISLHLRSHIISTLKAEHVDLILHVDGMVFPQTKTYIKSQPLLKF